MQYFNSIPLAASSLKILGDLNQQIKQEVVFDDKVNKAYALWNAKTSTNDKRITFDDVKKSLLTPIKNRDICAYCEANEPSDIEHIFPKSHFPEKAFEWENYLYVCKTCNTKHKSDYFQVFYSQGSDQAVELFRTTTKPPTEDNVFINQRKENPREYFILNLESSIFDVKYGLAARNLKKANYTLDLLKLNQRGYKGRKNAVVNYKNLLVNYINAKKSMNFSELKEAIHKYPNVDEAKIFEDEKSRILKHIQQSILDQPFPTVWEEMKLQRNIYKAFNELFQEAPEALQW